MQNLRGDGHIVLFGGNQVLPSAHNLRKFNEAAFIFFLRQFSGFTHILQGTGFVLRGRAVFIKGSLGVFYFADGI